MVEIFDVLIVGGGPGGYVTALRARQLGLSVALIEKERVGGVCLNRGCIPTKALLADVEGLQWVRRSFKTGVIASVPEVNFGAMQRRKADVVSKMVSNLEAFLAARGVTVVSASATVSEPGVVSTSSGETILGRHTVIATGSRSWVPPIPGADSPGVLTTRELLELQTVPPRLAVIGGGMIGQEFAAIFASVGARVTVLEALGRILSEVDAEMARKYASLLPALGITSDVGVLVRAIERRPDGLRIVYEKKGREKVVDADVILMATGRRPNLGGLDEEKLGLQTVHGAVHVDGFLETSVPGIYAVGDVIGRRMLAHVAYYHGEIVAENIAGRRKPMADDVVPACAFTTPQIAWVGMTEEQAAASGRGYRTSTFSLTQSGKALAMGEPRGWIKLIECTETGRLIAAHLMGPHVSELISELALAVRLGLSATDVADTIHPHPTLSEAVREAALGLLDGPIHAPGRTKKFP
jgi:dihydrolipoyl dehydrogenase